MKKIKLLVKVCKLNRNKHIVKVINNKIIVPYINNKLYQQHHYNNK